MADFTQYLAFLKDPESLMTILPVVIILVFALILVVPYIRSLFKKEKPQPVEAKQAVKFEKVDFPEELRKALGSGDVSLATSRVSSLANKFLARLFRLEKAFTYDEVKKEAKVYDFPEVVELCEVLSRLNFAKDSYSDSDLQVLVSIFTKVLDSYSHVLAEDSRAGKKGFGLPKGWGKLFHFSSGGIFSSITSKLVPGRVSFSSILKKISPVMKQVQVRQLHENLLAKHPSLFSSEIGKYSSDMSPSDKGDEILRLIKLGGGELKKGNTLASSGIYNSVVYLFNTLTPKERAPLGDKVNEFYLKVLNLVGVKACYEMTDSIVKALASNEYNHARQIFHQLKYVYSRLSYSSSMEVYRKWLESTQGL